METLLTNEYPRLSQNEYEKIMNHINGRFSEYYFLDYLRCSNGDIEDAIYFSKLDDELRSLIMTYFVRFELQIKNDFAKMVGSATKSNNFWELEKFYHPNARKIKKENKSNYLDTKENINKSIAKLSFVTVGPPNYVAMYCVSFGTFISLFKYINLKYKKDFINRYLSNIKRKDWKLLYHYLLALKQLRNRCAHGNHIISKKFARELNSHILLVNKKEFRPISNQYMTVFESLLLYLVYHLKNSKAFLHELKKILLRHKKILTKYQGNHSLYGNTSNSVVFL